jgi:hypothetical protein
MIHLERVSRKRRKQHQDRMGGIRGKPTVEDLLKIKKDAKVSAEKS